jgi:hypothetical protein
MAQRSFPLLPRSAKDLEIGDLIAVPCEVDAWACLQVVALKRSGRGSRTSFIAGVLPWCGDESPTPQNVLGLAAINVGMVPVELFTDGGLRVVANATVVPTQLSSSFRDFEVGAVHRVWGWKTAIRKAQAAAADTAKRLC